MKKIFFFILFSSLTINSAEVIQQEESSVTTISDVEELPKIIQSEDFIIINFFKDTDHVVNKVFKDFVKQKESYSIKFYEFDINKSWTFSNFFPCIIGFVRGRELPWQYRVALPVTSSGLPLSELNLWMKN